MNNKDETLTYLEGFVAFQKMVDICFHQTAAEDFNFVGSMIQLCADGGTADPASWYDWLDAIEDTLGGKPEYRQGGMRLSKGKADDVLTSLQAYNAMKEFLKEFAARGEDGDITIFLEELEKCEANVVIDNPWWGAWEQCVEEARKPDSISYMRFLRQGEVVSEIEDKMTSLETLVAIRKFLESYYKVRFPELQQLLDGMRLCDDGMTIDLDIMRDWLKAIKEVTRHKTYNVWYSDKQTGLLTAHRAFSVMGYFLQIYTARVAPDKGKLFLKECDGVFLDYEKLSWWLQWLHCIRSTLKGKNEVVPSSCRSSSVPSICPSRFDQSLTHMQAFNAMRKLLENYQKETQSDDIATFLVGFEFLSDGGTADPAAWHDWLDAADKAIEEKEIPLMQLTK